MTINNDDKYYLEALICTAIKCLKTEDELKLGSFHYEVSKVAKELKNIIEPPCLKADDINRTY